MGMFDTVTCKISGVPDIGYQTKDLGCTMDDYEITEDGRLFRRYTTGYPADDEFMDKERQVGYVNFTGEISIYGDYGGEEGRYEKWLQLDVRLEDGKVMEVFTGCAVKPLALAMGSFTGASQHDTTHR